MNTLILFALSLFSNPAEFQAKFPTSDSVPLEAKQSTRTARLLISGMRTKNCPVLVKMALSKLGGVTRVTANSETKTVTVSYEPSSVSLTQIRATIKDRAGFDSEVIEG